MNKYFKFLIIVFIKIIIFSHLYSAEKDENTKSSDFIKRTVLILPFLNKNNIIEYDYLSDILNDTLKSELLKTDLFNFTAPALADKKIKESGTTKEELEQVETVKSLALKLQADVFVIGKYVIIENEIMIVIQAYDIFTGQLAVSTNIKGGLGIDLFRVIEDASKDMADKMAEKLQMVKKSYFTEMSRLIRKEKMAQLKERFTPTMKAGIGATTVGGSLFLIGIPLLIYDLAGYSSILKDNLYNNERSEEGYTDYLTASYTSIGLFVSSIVLMGLGITGLGVGIPLIIYDYTRANKKISFNVEVGREINIVFCLKL